MYRFFSTLEESVSVMNSRTRSSRDIYGDVLRGCTSKYVHGGLALYIHRFFGTPEKSFYVMNIERKKLG